MSLFSACATAPCNQRRSKKPVGIFPRSEGENALNRRAQYGCRECGGEWICICEVHKWSSPGKNRLWVLISCCQTLSPCGSNGRLCDVLSVEHCIFTGFPRRLENIENENGHGKDMEHENLAKSHGTLWSVTEFYQYCPPNCTKFVFFWSSLRN